MPSTDYSNNFLLFDQQAVKNLVIAVKIDGLDTILTSGDLFRRVRYGDEGLDYGDVGLVYGGLIERDDFESILDLNNSSLTIQQKIEPEQGRSSVTLLSLAFIDKDQFMSQLIAPGVILDDILGKQIRVYMGFQEISYPEDYCLIFRGRISYYDSMAGRVLFQISDPNVVRRKQVFFTAKTTLSGGISDSDTTIDVASNADFHEQILGPDGSYDPAVTTYIQIDDEVIEYPATGYGTDQFIGCTRGARGTTPAAHDNGSEVTAMIQIEDDAIDMALKHMLSGWEGPYIEDVQIGGFVETGDPIVGTQPDAIVLPSGVDAIVDLGIAPGDYLTVSGAAATVNNGPCQVVLLRNTESTANQVIITDKSFSPETPSSATMAIRSQYDTYPETCGVRLPGFEVDVQRHQNIQSTFLGSDENRLRFLHTQSEDSLKSFMEAQIYLPLGCYSLTRFGRLSMQLTHAPLADQRLQVLDADNVVNPQQIRPQRGVNTRKFFNQINWQYEYDDAGNPTKIIKLIDLESINVIGITSLLPIEAKGVHSDLTTLTTINRRTNFLLSRYKRGAVIVSMQVDFGTGVLIEAGDVVAVKDNGGLQISNFTTGQRDLGSQLFEVIDRSFNIKTGQVSLQIVSGLGADVTDRYATFSPASVILSGSTTTRLILQDGSFGSIYEGQEQLKWFDYVGLRMLVHTEDWSTSATCTLTSMDATNSNAINISTLPFTPSAGMIIDIDYYSESSDPNDQAFCKIVHCFWDPMVTAVSGVSSTAVAVPATAVELFTVGLPILVHNEDFSVSSPECFVTDASTATNIITVDTDFGFTPSAGNSIELIGFHFDGSGPYRYI